MSLSPFTQEMWPARPERAMFNVRINVLGSVICSRPPEPGGPHCGQKKVWPARPERASWGMCMNLRAVRRRRPPEPGGPHCSRPPEPGGPHLLPPAGARRATLRRDQRLGTTSSVKDVNEPVLRFLTVSVIFSVHLPRVLVPS